MLSDPVDKLWDDAEKGKALIKNGNILNPKYRPDVILHRDDEQKQIAQSLIPILRQTKPSNLLVYGKPGTGKTLVVRKVISKIQSRVEESEFPIGLFYANSKDQTTIYGLLVSLGRELGLSNKELPKTGLAISEVFKRLLACIEKNETNAVFVIDEIDHLALLILKTGKDVLYQLTRANERLKAGTLTIVGISNDLTFKERLDPRVISSLGEEEIIFTNYSADQLKEILEARANEALEKGAIGRPALNLCAAMAAREHGDARRAIALLKEAALIAERQSSDEITEEHVRDAYQEIEDSIERRALQSYPLHEQLLVVAVMRAAGSSTGEIYTAYKGLCRTRGEKHLTQRRVTQMLAEIEISGIISGRLVHQGIHGRTKKFKLTIHPDTVKDVLREVLQDVI